MANEKHTADEIRMANVHFFRMAKLVVAFGGYGGAVGAAVATVIFFMGGNHVGGAVGTAAFILAAVVTTGFIQTIEAVHLAAAYIIAMNRAD